MTSENKKGIRHGTLVQDNDKEASTFRRVTRQDVSDFITWREFIARTDKMDERLQRLESKMDARIQQLEIKWDGRIQQLESKLDGRIQQIENQINQWRGGVRAWGNVWGIVWPVTASVLASMIVVKCVG